MPSVAEISADELIPGRLARLFQDGAVAVRVSGDPALGPLWEALMCNRDECLPWEATLDDLFRNLIASDDLTETLGDTCYARTDRHIYLARKVEVQQEEDGHQIVPPFFHQGNGVFRLSQEVAAQCWAYASRILEGMAPLSNSGAAEPLPPYRVAVQRIHYTASAEAVDRYMRFFRNAIGRWGKIGMMLDARREDVRGPLARRGWCDTLALLSTIPLLGLCARWISRLSARFDDQGPIPEGCRILSKAHYDSRYFSALCGLRADVRTEVRGAAGWEELTLDKDAVVIIPGLLAQQRFGIKASLHRVLQVEGAGPSVDDPHIADTTLLLGAK